MANARPPADQTVAMFDEVAEAERRNIDAQLATGTYRRAAVLVDAVERATPRAGRILDYGCGTGRISFMLARRGFVVLGVDPSRARVQIATAQDAAGLLLEFRHIGPSETSGREAESFDSILCSSVIEFIPDPVDLLSRLRELMRPEGRLLLSYASRTSAWRRYAEWRFRGRERHFRHQKHVWHEPDAFNVLRQAGFEKAGPTEFFESPFDRYDLLRPLSRLRAFGTLGLALARKAGG